MSYGIIRVQKFTAGSVLGIQIHDLRKKDVSHTNKDIDFELSHLNYDLHTGQASQGLELEEEPKIKVQKINTGQNKIEEPSQEKSSPQEKSFRTMCNDRIKQLNLTRAVRKDAIVMAQAMVTSDSEFFKGLSKEKQEQFFRDSYDFLKERYGKENIISCWVHLDEKTPHMHFNFVPVTDDGRLSAKKLFTPKTLRDLQDRFYGDVAVNYGLERGIEGSKTRHLPVLEYKVDTAKVEISALKSQKEALENQKEILETQKSEIDSEIEQSQNKVQELKNNIKLLESKENEIKGRLGIIEGHIKNLEEQKTELENELEYIATSRKEIEDIDQRKKHPTFGVRNNIILTGEDYEKLKSVALSKSDSSEDREKIIKAGRKMKDHRDGLLNENKELLGKNKKILDENKELKGKIEKLETKKKLASKEQKLTLKEQMQNVRNSQFAKIPEHRQKEMLNSYHAEQGSRQRDASIER